MCAKNLNDDNDGPNDKECWVGEDSIEDVDLVINLSGANHIEDLHEHEQVEDDGQVAGWCQTLKRLVNWSLLRVLLHAHQHIELTLAPLVLQILVVSWICFLQFFLDIIESNYLSCGRSAVFATNFVDVFWMIIKKLFGNEA